MSKDEKEFKLTVKLKEKGERDRKNERETNKERINDYIKETGSVCVCVLASPELLIRVAQGQTPVAGVCLCHVVYRTTRVAPLPRPNHLRR